MDACLGLPPETSGLKNVGLIHLLPRGDESADVIQSECTIQTQREAWQWVQALMQWLQALMKHSLIFRQRHVRKWLTAENIFLSIFIRVSGRSLLLSSSSETVCLAGEEFTHTYRHGLSLSLFFKELVKPRFKKWAKWGAKDVTNYSVRKDFKPSELCFSLKLEDLARIFSYLNVEGAIWQ